MKELVEPTACKTSGASSGRRAACLGRILVADDDAGIRTLVTEVLICSGYDVDSVENGERGWNCLQLKSYDLLITDQDMPKLTGLQLVHKLRVADFQLPIVIASGRLISDLLESSEWLGTTSMLPKPFTLDELTGTVKRLLPRPLNGLDAAPWSHYGSIFRESYANH